VRKDHALHEKADLQAIRVGRSFQDDRGTHAFRLYNPRGAGRMCKYQSRGECHRVNGVVRNMDAWYAAFDAKPTDRLYLAPAERVRIW